MKILLTPLLVFATTGLLFAGGTPGGPWANGAPYAGYLNGKYVGVVTGDNISGVLGFGISDGAPPFRTISSQTSSGGSSPVALENSTIRPDVTQNYFVIFVEGRTYSGLTTAGIDIDSKTVAGALQGTDPVGMLPAGTTGGGAGGGGATLPTDVAAALSIINRGLSGGFSAKIKSSDAVFTFKGDGQLSTPANQQSFSVTSIPEQPPAVLPPPTVPTNTITNQFVTGTYRTETTPFKVKGIRTSFSAFSL